MTTSPSTLLELLASRPKGASASALAAFLADAGVHAPADAVARALDELHREGRVAFGRDRRWRLKGGLPRAPGSTARAVPDRVPPPGAAEGAIHAIPARFGPAPADETPSVAAADGRVDPSRLLGYWERVLRRDARGEITVDPERHGASFVLFTGEGGWWPSSERATLLRLDRDAIPAAFREALARRETGTVAVGWPIAVVRTPESVFLQPVAVFMADRADDGDLVYRLPDQSIFLNPTWLDGHARGSGWQPGRLRDHLLGEAETASLSDPAPFAARLAEAAATRTTDLLDPARLAARVGLAETAIVGAAGIFLSADVPYTRAAAEDLAGWRARVDLDAGATALGALLGEPVPPPQGPGRPLLNPVQLSWDQIAACRAGLRDPLTVVTGPPGTGKSQAVASLVVSEVAAGGSVLFASRNHQAIDAVEDRLGELAGERLLVTRARDRGGTVDLDFTRAIDAIVQEGPPRSSLSGLEPSLADLRKLDAERRAKIDRLERTNRLAFALAEVLERLGESGEGSPHADPMPRKRRGLLAWLRALFRRPGQDTGTGEAAAPAQGASAGELRAAREALRTRLAEVARERENAAAEDDGPVELTERLREEAARLLPDLADAIARPQRTDAEKLREDANRAKLEAGLRVRTMPEHLARAVLRHRPVWASTTLAVPGRIPPIPALFDLLIVDEASQCDIASAVPLLLRARRAVIVGDPHQLPVINDVTPSEDRRLFAEAGLDPSAAARYAQSVGTVFDLAASARSATLVMLRDQFRSDAAIVGYLNEAFYGMRLRPARRRDSLEVPPGARPGLHWEDVTGPLRGGGGRGCSSEAEAEAIAAALEDLAAMGFAGSVGVIAPFRQQVATIEDAARGRVSPEALGRLDVKIATVDAFQGGERDVILFSLAAGTTMPPGARRFIEGDRRRFNVAVSRARAVCRIFGDLAFARTSGIPHLARLAARANAGAEAETAWNGVFDSPWERRLHEAMTARGLEPEPQYEIGGRRLDFALFEGSVKLDVEVDGRAWHADPDGDRKGDDLWRDHQLRGMGWKVRRFWVHELAEDVEACLDAIERDLGRR